MTAHAGARLREIPWCALGGIASSLERPLGEILGGAPAEQILRRFLRERPGLSSAAREAVAEALFGVGLWRRRIRAGLDLRDPPPLVLLAGLVRDLGGRPDAEPLLGLAPGTLPPPGPVGEDLADVHSLPDWLAREIALAGGGEADALAGALGVPGPIAFRANLLRTSREALARRLGEGGVPTRPGRLARTCLLSLATRPNVLGLAPHREGLLEVQDEGSQLAGLALGARPGETVLDACAGAGGKTLLLAAEVGPRGRVHAADPDAERLLRLRARAARAGASGIVSVHGAAPPPALRVDRALVDAPCSELGPLRRGPDRRWRIAPASFAALPALQLAILSRASSHVRTGGVLVYATCTFRREENETVALAFESAHPAFRRVPPAAPAGTVDEDLFLRTWPHRHGTDAFFAAAWVRGG